MGLLTKIFGNRDDPEAGGDGVDDGTLERETIELEPFRLTRDPVRGTSEASGEVPVAGAADAAPPEAVSHKAVVNGAAHGAPAKSAAVSRRKQRRSSRSNGRDDAHQPHELTRRRIARPTVSPVDVPPTPPPIPDVVPEPEALEPRAAAASEGDDPEEIDVSDELDEVGADDSTSDADLDASDDLIIEDDEPLDSDEEEEEETNTSVAVWGAAAGSSPAANSSPLAAPAPAAAPNSPSPEPTTTSPSAITIEGAAIEHAAIEHAVIDGAAIERAAIDGAATDGIATDGAGPTPPAPSQPAPEWTRMATDTKTPKQTLVEAGTEFTGTLKSSCPVVVNGSLDGDIDAPTLSIAAGGAIKGTIRATTLRSHGTLAGTIDATEVYVAGAVRSNTVIRAKRLECKIASPEKGQLQVTFGQCNLELSEMPLESDSSSSKSSPLASGTDTGNAGWDLPEAESRVTSTRGSSAVERARSK